MTVETDEFSDVRAKPPQGARKYPGALAFPHRKKLGPNAWLIIPDRANADFADFFESGNREDAAQLFRAAGHLVCDLGLSVDTKSLIILNALDKKICNSQQSSTHIHLVLAESGKDFPLHDLAGGPDRSYCPSPNGFTDTWIQSQHFRMQDPNDPFVLPEQVSEAPEHATLVLRAYTSFLHFLRQSSVVEHRRFARKVGAYISERKGKAGVRLVIDDMFRPPLKHMAVAHFYGGTRPGDLGKHRWFEKPQAG